LWWSCPSLSSVASFVAVGGALRRSGVVSNSLRRIGVIFRPLRRSGVIFRPLRRGGVMFGSLRFLLVQIAQYLLDPILVCDRFVKAELNLGHAPQAQPAAHLPPKERRGAFQRGRGLSARGGVTHHRVKHARQLEIGRHLHTGEGDETDTGIVDDPATEKIAQLLSYLIADAVRSVALSH
jgi:hypothetical protein